MGIPVEDFLYRYFNPDQLKEILFDIGIPVGRTKKERIDRILENWQSHNRDWYELLEYLDWSTLSQICDDFNILYSDYAKEDTLRNKIEDEWVLDFRKKTNVEHLKKSDDSITSNPVFHMPHNKRDWSIILGILGIGVSLFFGIPQLYYFMNPVPLIVTNENDELKILEINQEIIRHYDEHKPYKLVWESCGLSYHEDKFGNFLGWEFDTKPRLLDKDGNEALIDFNTIFTFSTQYTDGGKIEYGDTVQMPVHYVPTRNVEPIKINMTSFFEEGLKFQPSVVILILEKSGFVPYSKVSDINLKEYELDRNEKVFAEFIYLPDGLDKWVLDAYNTDSICKNLYQR